MKCDELKAFNCVDSDVQDFCEPRLVYSKSEVDAAIAELKRKNRKLKRALWLARAWGANQRTKYLDLFLTGRAHAIRKYKWIKITSKCIKKAEEYK